MQFEEVIWYSSRVNRNMSIKIYGHYGPAIIVFPCQDKYSDDFSNNHMIEVLEDLINDGKFKLYCVDSNDFDTVSSKSEDTDYKGYLLEQYHQYIINEVLPFIYQKQGSFCQPYTIGCSMGGAYASISYYRRPDLFKGFLSLSGSFDISSFFMGYLNSDIYNNSPVHFLNGMDNRHPYIEQYKKGKSIVVCGNGSYEFLVRDSNLWLEDVCKKKNINTEFYFLDESNIHDWYSWRLQIRYYLQLLINF